MIHVLRLPGDEHLFLSECGTLYISRADWIMARFSFMRLTYRTINVPWNPALPLETVLDVEKIKVIELDNPFHSKATRRA